MNFPRFWARGRSGDFMCWRWSSQSLAEAQSLADEAARQLAGRFRGGEFVPSPGGYYPNRPFREQVLKEITDNDGGVSAVITRNSYGCLVLNTARVMFVDIDLPEPRRPRAFFIRIFGWPRVTPPPSADNTAAVAIVENWTRNHFDWGWRIYRTRAGLRLLATHDLVSADTPATNDIFEALGADPLYRKLCQTQKCYRARLTPKPWRCDIFHKPARWPWLDAKSEAKFKKWESQYLAAAEEYATCELLRQIGNPAVHPAVAEIVKLHDDATRASSKLALA